MKELISRFAPQNFNDLLCLVVLAFIFTLWLLNGLGKMSMDKEVLGATIAFFTIVSQYYFRKAKEEK